MAPSSPAGMARRPTMDRPNSNSNSNSHGHPHSQGTGASSSTSTPHQPANAASRRVSVMMNDDDRGLVMREKDRDEKGSIGKAGGVGVGVTRPKRRLSSLPTLPPPNFNSHRATSTGQGQTPPVSPGHPHSNSTYQALQHSTAAPAGHYSNPYARSVSSSRPDEKIGMVGYAAGLAAASREKEGPPMLFGIELKWISLITLALQNAFLTIIMHYSRIRTSPNHTYSAATAVLFNELLKGSISLVIALKRIDNDMLSAPPPPVWSDKGSSGKNSDRRPSVKLPTLFHPSRLSALSKAIFSADCYKLSVPAILYVIQNNLQYLAASNLDVATFQVTYQMKILTTAFFSVMLLGKRLSKEKWASLILLAIGVGIVQIQNSAAPVASNAPTGHVKINHSDHQLRSEIPVPDEQIIAPLRVMHPLRGFLAVTMACMTSGLAGVYFEFILKSSSGSTPPPDLWVRNTQLSLFSLIPAIVPILFAPAGPAHASWLSRVMSSFSNFNGWAMGTVLTQTFGGLITAIVIRYSDNIMKGFATSLSIIISFLASVALFSYPITLAFLVGSSIVLSATIMYNSPSTPSAPPTRTTVGVTPGSPITSNAPILGEPEKEKPSRTSSVINLLGLGGSNANSRKPSSTDLRSQLGLTSNMTSMNTHYSASAPGTPYLSYSSGGETSASATGSPSMTYSAGVGGPGTGFSAIQRDKGRPVLNLDTLGNAK